MKILIFGLFLVLVPLRVVAQVDTPEVTTGSVALDRDEEAHAEFLVGEEEFAAGHYEGALRHFRAAYDLSARPELLYNIGHTSQLLGRADDALAAYQSYLEALPNAGNRRAVESRMETIRQRQTPTQATQTEPGGAGGAGPWILMGGGAAVVVVGTVFLALAGSAASNVDDAIVGTPWTQLESDFDRSETFSAMGGVGLGVGAALLLSGGIWQLVSGRRGSEARAAFQLDIHLGGASARLSF